MNTLINAEDFKLSDALLNYVKANPEAKQTHMQHLAARKAECTKLLVSGISLNEPDAIASMHIARQKLRALEAATQQIIGD